MFFTSLKNVLYTVVLFAVLVGFVGCAELPRSMPTAVQPLTSEEVSRATEAVAGKLTQMLGGRYHDHRIVSDLDRLSAKNHKPVAGEDMGAERLTFIVTDKSSPELYILPGRFVLLTRGLLADLQDRAELEAILEYAHNRAIRFTDLRYKDELREVLAELESPTTSIYHPDSAAIRLARKFKSKVCGKQCLAAVDGAELQASGQKLPSSVARLAGLKKGYGLLVKALMAEKTGDGRRAMATYQKALKAAPGEPRLLASLGMAHLRSGFTKKAQAALLKAVEAQPDYYRTHMGSGYLYLQTKQIKKANRSLALSVRLLPVTENLFLLAEAREKSGDTEGAILLYQLVASTDHESRLGRTATKRLAEAAGRQ